MTEMISRTTSPEGLTPPQAVEAERAFLVGLGGGCTVPIAAHATVEAGTLRIIGRVTSLDGRVQLDSTADGSAEDALRLGARLAEIALAQGAAEILAEAAEPPPDPVAAAGSSAWGRPAQAPSEHASQPAGQRS